MGTSNMKEKERELSPNLRDDDEWGRDERLCPECEGRGFCKYPGKSDKEICMTCDGLGVIYED